MLHKLINLMGVVLPVMRYHGKNRGKILALIGSGCINIFAYVRLVLAVITLASHYRNIPWFSGWVYQEKPIAVVLLKTPGFWGFLAGCVLLFVVG